MSCTIVKYLGRLTGATRQFLIEANSRETIYALASFSRVDIPHRIPVKYSGYRPPDDMPARNKNSATPITHGNARLADPSRVPHTIARINVIGVRIYIAAVSVGMRYFTLNPARRSISYLLPPIS